MMIIDNCIFTQQNYFHTSDNLCTIQEYIHGKSKLKPDLRKENVGRGHVRSPEVHLSVKVFQVSSLRIMPEVDIL